MFSRAVLSDNLHRPKLMHDVLGLFPYTHVAFCLRTAGCILRYLSRIIEADIAVHHRFPCLNGESTRTLPIPLQMSSTEVASPPDPRAIGFSHTKYDVYRCAVHSRNY